MTRVFCDRCGVELTTSATALSVDLVDVPDPETFDLCADCFAGFRRYMHALKEWDAVIAGEHTLPFEDAT